MTPYLPPSNQPLEENMGPDRYGKLKTFKESVAWGKRYSFKET